MKRIFVAATGAGAGAQQDIWKVPGCSAYFAGAAFPYGRDQLMDFIGYEPEKYVSGDTAIEMAIAAYYRAYQPGAGAIGVGLSAAVATSRPRRGADEVHVAVMTEQGVKVAWYNLQPSNRIQQGEFADFCVHLAIQNGRNMVNATARAEQLFFKRPFWSATGERLAAPPAKRTLYPGAFNPPHNGHREIADATNAIFWIESTAPNKPALSLTEMVQRAKLLHHRDRLLTSGYPLYVNKSTAFPKRSMVIGADALLRMLDPKWGIDPLDVLRCMSENETTLLVVGREINGRFVSAEEAIAFVPESGTLYDLRPLLGRWDISSSEVRQNGNSTIGSGSSSGG